MKNEEHELDAGKLQMRLREPCSHTVCIETVLVAALLPSLCCGFSTTTSSLTGSRNMHDQYATNSLTHQEEKVRSFASYFSVQIPPETNLAAEEEKYRSHGERGRELTTTIYLCVKAVKIFIGTVD